MEIREDSFLTFEVILSTIIDEIDFMSLFPLVFVE